MNFPYTSVKFSTNSEINQKQFDTAQEKSKQNLQDFCGRKVLIEGGGYHKIWLETQPMGGEMYAKRDLEAAANNILLFMEYQREDGRLPGSITVDNGKILPQFDKFQGFCFPAPALNLYYWLREDRTYLQQLYTCLERFDDYLWKTRSSGPDDCLQTWCVYDTGEDNGTRFEDAPRWWDKEVPPEGFRVVPIRSMDITSFSFTARNTLAKISLILKNGKDTEWDKKAKKVRAIIRNHLWSEDRGACFDIDKNGNTMPALIHNTLRCMYWESISQDMADRFVSDHLLNPAEFWTPMPLPSVAANDPQFRNCDDNDWSGQAQGLTYQRALQALNCYGYQHLLPQLAEKLFHAIGSDCLFTQQFDPFTGKPSGTKDGYGPTMLSVLEYTAWLQGIHLQGKEIWWGAAYGGFANNASETDYSQTWIDKEYRICSNGKKAEGFYNGKKIFDVDCGVRVITDYEGNIIKKEFF